MCQRFRVQGRRPLRLVAVPRRGLPASGRGMCPVCFGIVTAELEELLAKERAGM